MPRTAGWHLRPWGQAPPPPDPCRSFFGLKFVLLLQLLTPKVNPKPSFKRKPKTPLPLNPKPHSPKLHVEGQKPCTVNPKIFPTPSPTAPSPPHPPSQAKPKPILITNCSRKALMGNRRPSCEIEDPPHKKPKAFMGNRRPS